LPTENFAFVRRFALGVRKRNVDGRAEVRDSTFTTCGVWLPAIPQTPSGRVTDFPSSLAFLASADDAPWLRSPPASSLRAAWDRRFSLTGL
jgi:hypothetical protein